MLQNVVVLEAFRPVLDTFHSDMAMGAAGCLCLKIEIRITQKVAALFIA